jgi:hypothetical protein
MPTYEPRNSRLPSSISVVLILVTVLVSFTVGARPSTGTGVITQAKPSVVSEPLSPMLKRFGEYQHDFADMARTVEAPSLEYDIETSLDEIADHAGDYANSISILLSIYENLSCENDKRMTGIVIRQQLSLYIKQVDGLITETNINLPHTKTPAVSTTAINMKNDLRNLKDFLGSLQNSLQ